MCYVFAASIWILGCKRSALIKAGKYNLQIFASRRPSYRDRAAQNFLSC